jgi:hypothetical protein
MIVSDINGSVSVLKDFCLTWFACDWAVLKPIFHAYYAYICLPLRG